MTKSNREMVDEKLEAMRCAYADYPSQDNEGYVPDRAGFKAGFYAAWNLLQAEKKEAVAQAWEEAADLCKEMENHAKTHPFFGGMCAEQYMFAGRRLRKRAAEIRKEK